MANDHDETGSGLFVGQVAQSFGLLDAVMSETLGMAMHNAVRAQSNMQMVNAAAVVASCARILSAVPGADTPLPPSPPPAPGPDAPTGASPAGLLGQIAKDAVRAQTAVDKLASDHRMAQLDVQQAAEALQTILGGTEALPDAPKPRTPANPDTQPDTPKAPSGSDSAPQ